MNRRRTTHFFLILGLACLGSAMSAFGQSTGVGLTGEVKDTLLPGPELRVNPKQKEKFVVHFYFLLHSWNL